MEKAIVSREPETSQNNFSVAKVEKNEEDVDLADEPWQAQDEIMWASMEGPDVCIEAQASLYRNPKALDRSYTSSNDLVDPDRTGRRGGSASAQHNIFDSEYNNIWESGIQVIDDAPNAEIAMQIMLRLKRHGWRVTELHESTSHGGKCAGTCWPNGHGAGSIVLVLRVGGSKFAALKSYESILAVMLHEMTHIEMNSNNHGPPFRALCTELRRDHQELNQGAMRPDFECEILCGGVRRRRRRKSSPSNRNSRRWAGRGRSYQAFAPAARRTDYKRPLLKGRKMIDERTRDGKQLKHAKMGQSPATAAAAAALLRFERQLHDGQNRGDNACAVDANRRKA